MDKPKRYLITAALPYANGPLHIGHIAGAYLPADIYVRYLRLKGEDVVFVCGSDEHGAAITLRAKKEGTTPKAIVDKYHVQIKETFERFGINFNIYHRTSSELHHTTASDFFKVLNENGKFTKETSEQFYDEENKQFLADRYITGTCPKCGYESAYGDQCEKCGSSLNPKDLINPISTLSGKPPVLKETFHWYLPMNEYEGWLKEWLIDGHKEWKANVYGQCKSWIDGGLQPRAMTRDLDWGVKVPVKDAEGKVLYVWLDAPIGYISATKQWALDNNRDWKPYWMKKDTKLVHFIGKDNIVFHCIIFPIILKAHGDYILPENVPANEFLNLEGNKLSTSRNWAIWLHEYLDEFPGKEDVLRYTLCSIMPETKDSEFTWKDFQARNNNELASILGNFVNRVMVLTQNFFEGKVPDADECSDLKQFIEQQKAAIETSLEGYRFREAVQELMNVARHGNKLLTEKEPWKLIKTDKKAAGIVLYDCLQIIVNLAVLCEPFLPFTSQKIRTMLNLDASILKWENIGKMNLLKPDHQLGASSLLFEKVEDDVIRKQIDKLHASAQVTATATPVTTQQPAKPSISYDDFSKLDLRVGKILSAEKVEKADKLLKLQVDLGYERRTVVSGIAQFFKPEEIIGKKVSLVANLASKKIKGIESHGMILMAEDAEGKLAFVSSTDEMPDGSSIR